MLDLTRIRRETPACEQVLHFNNAGSSLCPEPVSNAVIEHLKLEQQVGGYEAAVLSEEAQQRFYTAMATLLHCQPSEVAFVENATRAWELALYSLPLQAGDEIITFGSEYASNYMGLLHIARQKQLHIKLIPFDQHGQIDIECLESTISPRSRLIALTHVASQRGDILPAEEVGKIAKQHGLYYLLDACQSAGQIDLNCKQIGCDFLAGTGRKYLRGPRGTGFLYVNNERMNELEPLFVDLQSAQWDSSESFSWLNDARRFETFERHVAGMIGLGVAADYANNIGLTAIEERVQGLAVSLRERLQELSEFRVHEHAGPCSGIVTFSSIREDALSIKQRLEEGRANVSITPARNARLDLAAEGIESIVRASVHYYNSEAEIERFVALLTAADVTRTTY